MKFKLKSNWKKSKNGFFSIIRLLGTMSEIKSFPIIISKFIIFTLVIMTYSCNNNKENSNIIQCNNFVYCFDIGNKALSEGKFNDAIEYYNNAIELNPNIAEIYVKRGLAKSELKDFESAIKDFEIASSLSPTNLSIINQKGLIKYKAKLYENALNDFNYVLNKDSTFSDSYLNRGMVKMKMGRKSEGCEDFYSSRNYGNKEVNILIEKHCK